MNISRLKKPRNRPRISITKLAEYLEALPMRRRKILIDQKYPPDYQTTWYNECFEPIVNFLLDPSHATEPLHRAMAEISSKTAINEKQVIARSNNIEALKHLLNTRNKFPFTGYTLRRLPEQAPHLHVAGVSISVRPELEILNVGRNDQVVRYGYLKLYINKRPSFSRGDRQICGDDGSSIRTLPTPGKRHCRSEMLLGLGPLSGRVTHGASELSKPEGTDNRSLF
jgi:hypothetical protein